MASIRRDKALRIFGLIFMAIPALYFAHLAQSDVSASLQQNKLKQGWESMEDSMVASLLDSQASIKIAKESNTGTADETTEASLASTRVPYGKPFAKLIIPKIKLDVIVLEGSTPEIIDKAPGHLEETAQLGEVGNVAISGHRVTHSRPFFYLDELRVGDQIHLYYGDKEFTYYVVDQKVVKPTDVSIINPTKDRTLTLLTCNPRYSARTRLAVVAKMKTAK